jgi:hypothetical protein
LVVVVPAENAAADEGVKHASIRLAATANAKAVFFTAPKPLPKVLRSALPALAPAPDKQTFKT